MIKFPYGRRDFNEIITEDYLYLDRTHYIRYIEDWGKELLFMRPRRFGKSLWLSTLMNYYDIAKADDFERLFGHLEIGRNPTPLHNQYMVMRWDFSRVPSHGTIEQIEKALHNQLNVQTEDFQRKYDSYLADKINIYPGDSLSTFYSLLSVVQASNHILYLFIDEYDNFANEVMMGAQGYNQQRYAELVEGEGMFKTLFKNLKGAAGEGLDRIFVTGVSPVVINDLTSGANIFEDITWNADLNDLCGFTDAEVHDMVEQVVERCDLPTAQVEETMHQMESFYNGSRFVTGVPDSDLAEVQKVYNPTLVFYFLKRFQAYCRYPDVMLDSNLEPDGNKIRYAARHDSGQGLLKSAIEGEVAVDLFELQRRFGVTEMLNPDKQAERLAILLTYLGVLTVSGMTPEGKVKLGIPNQVIRKLYADRLLESMTQTNSAKIKAGRDAADALCAQGALQPLADFIEQELMSLYSNRDARDFSELTLKTLFLSVLHYNHLYVLDSEPELLRRYGDLIMLLRPGMRHYKLFDLLFEFKHIRLNELRIKDNDKTSIPSGKDVQHIDIAQLEANPIVEARISEAANQLQDYRRALAQKYGDDLKLRTYAIVSIGFERIVWREVS